MSQGSIGFDSIRYRQKQLSRHARKRLQQRAIPESTVGIIELFGEREYDGHGGIRVVMTQRSVQRLQAALGRTQKTDSMLGMYLVLAADAPDFVVTGGHIR